MIVATNGAPNTIAFCSYRTATESMEACDNHPTCAGFTYRGLINQTSFPDKKYETFFFNYIPFIDTNKPYFNWVSYKTTKLFGIYNGTFEGASVKVRILFGKL